MLENGPSEWTDCTAPVARATIEVQPGQVVLSGEFDGSNRAEVGAAFGEAAWASGDVLLVDMAEVTFCGIALLHALLRLDRRCASRGIAMRILPSPVVRRALAITGIDGRVAVADV
ncbi:hypothetical protein GCM10027258_83330 [Amycolatopsis stemonae]